MPGRSARRRLLAAAAIGVLPAAGACVTRTIEQPGAVAAVAPQLSVERFLQAANERDLAAMSRLFGTADGPYADRGSAFGCFFKRIGSWFGGTACRSSQEIELEMDIIAGIIHHDDYRITGEERVAGRQSPTTRVLVDLRVGSQSARGVPFDVVRTSDGRWLVQVVGLEAAMDRR